MLKVTWESHLKEFNQYLKVERSLSDNTIEAYLRDVYKLIQFLDMTNPTPLEKVKAKQISDLLLYLVQLGISVRSQSRIISGLKSFFEFWEEEGLVTINPMLKIESPTVGRNLPDTLDFHEIEKILDAIDLSTPEGFRNRSMIETLYSSGLRVSELVQLKWSQINFQESFIKVIGKGNKERLVPIGTDARKYIQVYYSEIRSALSPKKGAEDIVYLNRRGGILTRQMVFLIAKQSALDAGILKNISPHTYRHSFATHLIEGGADLRIIQELLGHESIITTEIYTHLDNDFLSQTISQYHPRA